MQLTIMEEARIQPTIILIFKQFSYIAYYPIQYYLPIL
jgi:hypothetical protein